MADKMIVIGLDGGTYDVYDPAMKKGLMPNLKRFTEGGVKGPLETIIPPITGPAWVSFATGVNPGKHGTMSFFKPFEAESENKYELLNSSNIGGLTFWDIMASEGLKTVVVNIPQTFPPYPYDGVLITKIGSAGPNRMASHPAEWKEKINANSGVPSDWCLLDGISQTPEFLEHIIESIRNEIKINNYIINEADWDCLVSASLATDAFLHHFWRFIDPSHPLYDEKIMPRMGPLIDEFFSTVDAFVGCLLDAADSNTTVGLVSDHGFGPVHEVISVNNWLMENGWLVEKKSGSGVKNVARKFGIDSRSVVDTLIKLDVLKLRTKLRHGLQMPIRDAINSAFKLEFDWEKSKAYFLTTSDFGIHLIPPFDGQSREQFRDMMMEKLRDMKDSAGKPVFKSVYTREEIFNGPYVEKAPDIIIIPEGPRVCNTEVSDGGVIQPQKPGLVNGFHRPNGVFALMGPGIKKGAMIDTARILDVAPTLLYKYGIPFDNNMDGRVLTECFEEDHVNSNEPRGIDYSFDPTSHKVTETFIDDSDIEIEKKLKGLGYMD